MENARTTIQTYTRIAKQKKKEYVKSDFPFIFFSLQLNFSFWVVVIFIYCQYHSSVVGNIVITPITLPPPPPFHWRAHARFVVCGPYMKWHFITCINLSCGKFSKPFLCGSIQVRFEFTWTLNFYVVSFERSGKFRVSIFFDYYNPFSIE